jgi:hypothetical protein
MILLLLLLLLLLSSLPHYSDYTAYVVTALPYTITCTLGTVVLVLVLPLQFSSVATAVLVAAA